MLSSFHLSDVMTDRAWWNGIRQLSKILLFGLALLWILIVLSNLLGCCEGKVYYRGGRRLATPVIPSYFLGMINQAVWCDKMSGIIMSGDEDSMACSIGQEC